MGSQIKIKRKEIMKRAIWQFSLVSSARVFAMNRHEGQQDDTGKPYFNHVEQVAHILELVTKDEEIIAAGYLHDTLEDTKTTPIELVQTFGKRVASLVYEVTKDDKKDFPHLKSRDAILIKFADRLSNLSRMESWDEAQRATYLKKSTFWKAIA